MFCPMTALSKVLDWQDPLALMSIISKNYRGETLIFLYSASHFDIKNSFSYIALFPEEKLVFENSNADKITKMLSEQKKWFGYFGYEFCRGVDFAMPTSASYIPMPNACFSSFYLILEFDHTNQKLIAHYDDEHYLSEVMNYKYRESALGEVSAISVKSNFSNRSYQDSVSFIKQAIAKGEFCQTNLTRKFFGKLKDKITQESAFDLFEKSSCNSKPNYACFLKIGDDYIISNSPELFLKIDNRNVTSCPIKGTAPRDKDIAIDQINIEKLKNSPKERAENLMIVDLVRNDLARVCRPGSVKVETLCELNTYPNIHHMSSRVTGVIKEEYNIFDMLIASFPPGSMTGAPKIKAVEYCAALEKMDRGVYSGAIGFLDGNTGLNLNVVIRTILIRGDDFEMQSGGGITFDSDPKAEMEESFTKLNVLSRILAVDVSNVDQA